MGRHDPAKRFAQRVVAREDDVLQGGQTGSLAARRAICRVGKQTAANYRGHCGPGVLGRRSSGLSGIKRPSAGAGGRSRHAARARSQA